MKKDVGYFAPYRIRDALWKYKIKSRHVPAEGYEFDAYEGEFIKGKEDSLESKLSVVTLILLGTGLILLSPIITGNVIGNLNQNSSNLIGGILFVLGLVGSFILGKKHR